MGRAEEAVDAGRRRERLAPFQLITRIYYTDVLCSDANDRWNRTGHKKLERR
jgi:hypothetical protein